MSWERFIIAKSLANLDDLGLKGPKDRYNDIEIVPSVRKFILEHAQIFKRFMHDTWSVGLMISGTKCAIDVSGIIIVGIICDYDGRHSEQRKIAKIIAWRVPQSTKDARAFIDIVGYYRIFIISFAIIETPIFELFRKDVKFS